MRNAGAQGEALWTSESPPRGPAARLVTNVQLTSSFSSREEHMRPTLHIVWIAALCLAAFHACGGEAVNEGTAPSLVEPGALVNWSAGKTHVCPPQADPFNPRACLTDLTTRIGDSLHAALESHGFVVTHNTQTHRIDVSLNSRSTETGGGSSHGMFSLQGQVHLFFERDSPRDTREVLPLVVGFVVWQDSSSSVQFVGRGGEGRLAAFMAEILTALN